MSETIETETHAKLAKSLGWESSPQAERELQLKRIRAAERRVGRTIALQLDWLIDYIRKPTPSDLRGAIRRAEELDAFLRVRLGIRGVAVTHPSVQNPDLLIEHVAKMHLALSDFLTGRSKGEEYQTIFVVGGPLGRGYHRGSFQALTIFASREIVVSSEARQRLRLCAAPDCGRPFLKRKRGLYCSRDCGVRVKRARYFAIPREERSERRHQAYKTWITRHSPGDPDTREARAKKVQRRRSDNHSKEID